MEPESNIDYEKDEHAHEVHDPACDAMPDSTRLRYFHGQMLVAHDLQTEQDYFREKLKLLNRCLHGYGTVCGLKVTPVKDDYKDESDYEAPEPNEQQQGGPYDQQQQKQHHPREHEKHRRHARVEIECGLALDCEGNELIVRHPIRVDLWRSLTESERKQLEDDIDRNERPRPRVYVSICYCVEPIDPVRPVIPDACTAVSECVYSKLRDTVKVKVSLRRPDADHCADICCAKCKDKCLLLAMVLFERGRPIVVKNDVRRWVTPYEPVTITGINWIHGAENYTPGEARKILQRDGLTIQFSRPILPETINKGVVDVFVFQGGRGQHGGIYYLDGEVTTTNDNRHIVFKYTARETLQNADRVFIVVRTDFILDRCCRPVDGNHIGGRVPLLPAFQDNVPEAGMPNPATVCVDPPRRYGAWTSGNGAAGGAFESWFYIEERDASGYGQQSDQQQRYETEDDY
jgi:hypothetical protein